MAKKNVAASAPQDWHFSLTFDERFRMFVLVSLAKPDSVGENRRISQALSALENGTNFEPPPFATEEEVEAFNEQFVPQRKNRKASALKLSTTHVETLLACVTAVFAHKSITGGVTLMQHTRHLSRFIDLLEAAKDKRTIEGEVEPVVVLAAVPDAEESDGASASAEDAAQ